MNAVEDEPGTLPPPVRRPVTPHRVWRSRRKVVAGVAGGLADALGVAPVWTRLAFVGLTLFAGLGVVAYVAGWLLLPSGPWVPAPRLARRVVGLLLVPLWLMATVPGGAWWGPFDGPFGLTVLLVGVAVALWSPRSDEALDGPVPGTPWAPPDSTHAAVVTARPSEPRSVLGRITVGAALLAVAVTMAITQDWSTGLKIGGGIAVLVCAAGLLVGALYGRAWWLVVPAALFAGVSVAGAATEGYDVKGWRDVTLQIDVADEPVDREIGIAAGTVRIDAAEGVRLEVIARVGIGTIDMPSGSEEGYRRVAIYRSGPSDAPLVRYEVTVGFGRIEVARYVPGSARPIEPVPPVGPVLPVPPRGVVGSDGRGGLLYEDGTQRLADGTVLLTDGSVIGPGGVRSFASPTQVLPNGEVLLPDGTKIQSDGTVILPSGIAIEPAPAVTSPTTAVQP